MPSASLALPDVTLSLDGEGVIRAASLANGFAGENVGVWIGSHWVDTVSPGDSESLRHLLADVRQTGVGAFRSLMQRFPSGLEIPIEYTAVHLGEPQGMVAVGKNLRAVAELQCRLLETQQAMERDYWKLREVETRYRLLFSSSSEAVLVLGGQDLRVRDLNSAAALALGLEAGIPTGGAHRHAKPHHERHFPDLLLPQERESFLSAIRRARERGRAPGVLLRLGEHQTLWLVRVSLVASGEEILVQLAPSATVLTETDRRDPVPVEDLVEHGPDAFAAVDRGGRILRANRAFVDLVQMGSESAILGELLGRWLGRPGADVPVLLANLARRGTVRLFATALRGELGSEVDVEVSASARAPRGAGAVGVFIRDVSRRLSGRGPGDDLAGALGALARKIGKTTLRTLADETVAIVERSFIEAALDITGGNRTAAAELLGLSRQSLYVKLARYGLDSEPRPDPVAGR